MTRLRIRYGLRMRIDPRAWLRLPLPTLGLGAVLFTLVSAIVFVLVNGTRADALLATPARAVEPFVFEGPLARGAADLAAIQSQPLVHASRAFYEPPAEQAPAAPPRPDYRLAGAMILPGKPAVAVLTERNGGKTTRVKRGDELAGWRVASVDRKQVVLTWGNERAEITSGIPAMGPVTMAGATSTPGNSGLKRVPIVRQRVSAVNAGPRSLSATGNSDGGSAGPADSEPPRLFRPPPQ